jgi:aconitase B
VFAAAFVFFALDCAVQRPPASSDPMITQLEGDGAALVRDALPDTQFPPAVDPSCGACIAAGPGVSTRKDQVTVSAINRNYPGRSGPGQVYLASPLVVAASAIAGKIQAPTIETGS